MAIFSTYESIAPKENISDIISNISPTVTPFLTSLGTENTKNINYSWQEDSLVAVAVNAQSEGFTASSVTAVATVKRSGTTQILSKTAEVSNSLNAQESYGRDKELAYQLAKASKELKRDHEHALVGLNQATVTGDDASDGAGAARKFASADSQILAGNVQAGGTAALTEAMVLGVNQKVYTSGGEASILLIKPADALIFADFAYKARAGTSTSDTSTTARSQTITGTKIVNVVDFYQSPFGSQKVVIDRFIKTTNVLAYDPDSWRIMVYRPWTRQPLAITGDKQSVMIVGEYGLKHKNTGASGLINALT